MQGCKASSRVWHLLTLLTGMVECLFCSGLVFGYASLVFVLKEEGNFGDQCVEGPNASSTMADKDCSGQDEMFSLVFTIASFLNNFLALFNGCVFDFFGTMITRLLAICLFSIGTILMALSSAAFSFLLFPALASLAVGGILLLMTNMQVANLFPAHRSTVITLYNGAFDSSSAVFFIIKILYEQGICLRNSFLALSFCSILLVARTLLLMPRTHIPHPLPEDYTYGIRCGKDTTYNVEQLEKVREETKTQGSSESENTTPAPEERKEGQKTREGLISTLVHSFMDFCSHVASWFFLLHLLWLSIMQLRHYLFIGTLNSMLNRLTDNDPGLVSEYTNVFAMIQLCGVLCAPFNGLIIDKCKKKNLAPGETEWEVNLRSSYPSLFLTALKCLLFSVCATIPVLKLQYCTFILQVLNRSFLYGGNAAFINIAFPARHFGKLYGTIMALSALISLLQFPLFILVKGPLGGDPLYVNIAVTCLTLLAFIHPTHIFMHCKKEARRRENDLQPEDITTLSMTEA